MKTRTAICINEDGHYEPIHCRLWENWHGATYLCETEKQLRKEHPKSTFHGWVFDMDDPEHLQSLKCNFLSPNVQSVKVWMNTVEGFQYMTVTRDMLI